MQVNNSKMVLYFKNVNERIRTFEKNGVLKNTSTPINKNIWSKLHLIYILFYSLIDFFLLTILLFNSKFVKEKVSVVYTTANLCSFQNNKYSERIIQNIEIEKRVYINQGREKIIKKIDGYKVYNLGGIAKLFSFVFCFMDKQNKLLKAYHLVNNFVLFFLNGKNVYLLCHYDLNGISVVFSKHRQKINLIEVQHGGMINYPAYSSPSKVKIADTFIVKNAQTIEYLKSHLNKNFIDVSYTLLPYPKVVKVKKKGVHFLYASTVEIGGLYASFLEYLKIHAAVSATISIRLHPRELKNKSIFEEQIRGIKNDIIFDDSKCWLTHNNIENLIVISPWSSIIEEAFDNSFKVIILDVLGKDRYDYLIDNENVYYASNPIEIASIIEKLTVNYI